MTALGKLLSLSNTVAPVVGKLSTPPLLALYLKLEFAVLLIVTTPVLANVIPAGIAPTSTELSGKLFESASFAKTPKPSGPV